MWYACDQPQLSTFFSRPAREGLRERLIEGHRQLALAIARRLGHNGDEDIEQVALMGLVKAADRFDPDRGTRFSTFAVPTIEGEVKRYLRDYSRLVRPPRSLLELHDAVVAAEAELTARSGRSPTVTAIAAALGVEIDRVLDAMAMEDTCHPSSLDGLQETTEREASAALHRCLGRDDPELARVEERLAWTGALDTLPPPLRSVIELRYYEDLTQSEIARRLGISQMQVSRLERRALEKLRYRLQEEMPV
jgi:RNA polymerase sigma-B factor